jgi:uncharacterized RDD family membrane protein YckC
MADPLPCPVCSFANAPGADLCAKCGATLIETAERVHPGETLRDPDDLVLPPSPLLRAVLRGEAEVAPPPRSLPPSPAPAPEPRPSPAPAPALRRATAEVLSPSEDQAALLRELAGRLHGRKDEVQVHYAGFFVRAIAFLIDSAILGVFAVPLAAAGYLGLRGGMMVLGRADPIDADETAITFLMAAWFAMATVYFTVLHQKQGQTIGKSLLRIQVRTVGTLAEIGVVRSLVRTIAYAASSTFLGLGFLLIAITPRKRGWHDFLAGTCVIRATNEEATA